MSSMRPQRSPGCAAVKCTGGDDWFTAAKLGRISGPVLINALGWVLLSLLLYMASVLGLATV